MYIKKSKHTLIGFQLFELEITLLTFGIFFLFIGLLFCLKTLKLLKSRGNWHNYLVITILVIFFVIGYGVVLFGYINEDFVSFHDKPLLSISIYLFGSVFVLLVIVLNYRTIERIFYVEDTQYILESLVKERNQELVIEKQRLSQIVNHIGDGVVSTDAKNNIVLVNESVTKLLDIKLDTLIGQPYNLLITKLYSREKKPFIRVPVQQDTNYTKNLIITPNSDGSERYIEEKISTLITEGNISGYIIVLHDITHIIEFDQMRKKLVSSASHELRTPVTIIKQSIKSLNKYGDRISDETKNRLMDMISENATLLSEIVEGLELISSIDQRTLNLNFKEIDLRILIEGEISKLSSRIQAKNLQTELNTNNNEIKLQGDKSSLTKAFNCLIDNAIKYSRDGGKIIIEILDDYSGEYNTTQEAGILVQITDEGIGISKEYFDKIFERFFRIKDVNISPGVGIGLSIARSIFKLHNGEIFIKSELDKGSTFSVFLPKRRIKN